MQSSDTYGASSSTSSSSGSGSRDDSIRRLLYPTEAPSVGGGTVDDGSKAESVKPKTDLLTSGLAAGRESAETKYGQTVDQTSQQVQDIVARRQERLAQEDQTADTIRQSRNRQIQMARSNAGPGGVTSNQERQIARNAESDISTALTAKSNQDLSEYQKLIGNILGGQTAIEMGVAGLEVAGEDIPTLTQSSGVSTIICTELHRQGLMDDETFKKDGEYGAQLRLTHPDVYSGYILLASPIVEKMRISPLFTKFVAMFALRWASNMAGNKSIIGKLISNIGEPICGLVGRIRCQSTKMQLEV